MKNSPLSLLLFCLCLQWSALAASELKDQFGQPGGLSDHAGQVQLVIVVSAKKLRRLKPWEQQIRLQYPELPILRVADVPQSAPTEYASVAEKLRKRLPEDLAVLIDLDGEWVERFELDGSVPNLLVFDANGALLNVRAGLYKPALFAALQVDLDSALAAQAP